MNSEIKKPKRGRKATTVEAALPVVAAEKTNEQMRYAEELGKGTSLLLGYEETFLRLGRLEAFEFYRTVGDVAVAQIFEELRNSKAYIGLPYKDSDGNILRVGGFKEFCEVKLGKSYSRCAALAQNLRTLGPALYEQSERLGLRHVDYRAINALPSNEFEMVSQAIQSKDLDAVKQVLQEFVSKKQLDDEAHKRELEKAKEDAAAKGQVIVQKNNLITELVADKNRSAGLTEAEKLAELEKELFESTVSAIGAVLVMRNRIHAIRTLDKPQQGLYVACTGAIQRVTSDLMSIATDYGFELALGSDPEFDDDDPRKIGQEWLASRLTAPATVV